MSDLCRRTTDDDGRQTIAIGHLSNSGGLKRGLIWFKHILLYIYINKRVTDNAFACSKVTVLKYLLVKDIYKPLYEDRFKDLFALVILSTFPTVLSILLYTCTLIPYHQDKKVLLISFKHEILLFNSSVYSERWNNIHLSIPLMSMPFVCHDLQWAQDEMTVYMSYAFNITCCCYLLRKCTWSYIVTTLFRRREIFFWLVYPF